MTVRIKIEWTLCPDCGRPIIERDGLRVEVDRAGEDIDVEHECDPRDVE